LDIWQEAFGFAQVSGDGMSCQVPWSFLKTDQPQIKAVLRAAHSNLGRCPGCSLVVITR
jgi:hypothetical protein